MEGAERASAAPSWRTPSGASRHLPRRGDRRLGNLREPAQEPAPGGLGVALREVAGDEAGVVPGDPGEADGGVEQGVVGHAPKIGRPAENRWRLSDMDQMIQPSAGASDGEPPPEPNWYEPSAPAVERTTT